MELIELNIMRGPNYWAQGHNRLIVMKIKMADVANNFTTPEFAKRLEAILPSLKKEDSDYEDNFIVQVSKGIGIEKVLLRIALELQILQNVNCRYGFTQVALSGDLFTVVFSYKYERAGKYCAHAAMRITQAIQQGIEYNLEEDIKNLKQILRREKPGPSTQAIITEAERRNIPYTRLDNNSYYMLGYGALQKSFRATICCTTDAIAVDLVSDKWATHAVLAKHYIPVPDGEIISDESELLEAIESIGYPVVVKPVYGNHGRGITTRITNYTTALSAFHYAQTVSDEVLVEKHIDGFDYRLLVINNKLVAAAKRTPPFIVGDSVSTISELIDKINNEPNRGDGHEDYLTRVTIDENTMKILNERKFTLDTVLPFGEKLYLKDTANISSGGTADDVTDIVHPENIFIAERIARILNLNICGIDILAQDISQPLHKSNGGVLEVNAAPGFRMHISPSTGRSRDVGKPVLDMLFGDSEGRIPIVAITGTNGKTTTTRLVSHIARSTGLNVGYTTTDGIYINDTLITKGDCSGPESAKTVLRDPMVEMAVLECARGGILRSGLGFDQCNVSIVTNVTDDHLELKGINTLEELANVKAVVPSTTRADGMAILNANDALVCAMQNNLQCGVGFFSLHPDNLIFQKHIQNGGLGICVEDEHFVLYEIGIRNAFMHVADVPLTLSGKSECMIQNVMAAVLAARASNFSVQQIIPALQTFIPSAQTTPGRMNFFQFEDFSVLVDYAHNNAGFEEMKKYLANIEDKHICGIISATGDRRVQDIRNAGRYAAEMFNDIIINHQKDGRGRTNDELTNLMLDGIRSVDEHIRVTVISDEVSAVQHAMENYVPGALLVVLADDISAVLNYIQTEQRRKQEMMQKLYN